jgi:hypothetical protein
MPGALVLGIFYLFTLWVGKKCLPKYENIARITPFAGIACPAQWQGMPVFMV